MDMRPRIAPTLELGLMKATASLQDPEVSLSPWDARMPTICIEEGGVIVELEFPDRESLRRFQDRVAALQCPEEEEEKDE
jgi:hypothetical protein